MLADIKALKTEVNLPHVVETLTGHPGTKDGFYNCPICGSGTHDHKTPAFYIDPKGDQTHWKCFSARCGKGGDVLDLAGYLLGTDDKAAQVRQVMEWAGISEIDLEPYADAGRELRQISQKTQRLAGPIPTKGYVEQERAYIARAQAELSSSPEAIAYLQSRGIDAKAAQSLGLGYDPARRRIVILFPGSAYYHIDRAIDADGHGKYLKPKSDEAGPQPLWNPEALKGDLVIVVEGPFDALALTLAGYGPQTIALCGTAWRDLASELQARKYAGTVLVALDADEAGGDAQKALGEALSAAGVPSASLNVWERLRVKDAAEAWQADPDAMAQALAQAIAEGTRQVKDEREKRFQESLRRVRIISASRAGEDLLALKNQRSPISTGFKSIDALLGGGLFPGLYVLGAQSGYGKTTLVAQIADNIAKAGERVVFATLEQSAMELVAKSISRELAIKRGDGGPYAVSARDLMNPQWHSDPSKCTPGKAAAIVSVAKSYRAATQDRLTYVEARYEPSVEDIFVTTNHVREITGEAPIVIVDYLQILRASDNAFSDKQALDKNVSDLRRLARDLMTPVIAISSLNRSSYSGPITMNSFKESGAIEYGTDALMGLQSERMKDFELGDAAEAAKEARKTREATVKKLELTVMKNRWGGIHDTGKGAPLTFYGNTNFFKEDPTWRPKE